MSNPTIFNIKIVLRRFGGYRLLGLLVLPVLMTLWLTACTAEPASTGSNIGKGSYLTGQQVNSSQAGVFDSGITITIEKDGQPVGVLIRGTLTQGTLYARITDSAGQVVWKTDPAGGSFNVNATVTTLKTGKYALGVAWDEAVSGVYDLYTVPGEAVNMPQVSPVALIGGVGMMLVALAFIIYASVKRLGWSYMGLGMLGWVIAVALKFVWAIPANTPIYELLRSTLPAGLSDAVFDLYVGSLTGIFEVIPVWLVMRYTRLGKVNFQKALAFGIGFGAIEALLLGLINLTSVLLGLLAPNTLSVETVSQIAIYNNVLYSLMPVSERFFTVLIHIFANVLVFYAAAVHQPGAGRKPGYFWLAFAYKSLIDALAAYVQVAGLSGLGQLWLVEAVIAVWGALGWWGTRRVKQHYPGLPVQPEKTGQP